MGKHKDPLTLTHWNRRLINAGMEYQPARSEYKKVWSALSTTEDQAKLHVIGGIDEAALEATGEETLRFLQDSVGIRRDDVVLEIGCGIGRVGKVVAPLCRKRLFVLKRSKMPTPDAPRNAITKAASFECGRVPNLKT